MSYHKKNLKEKLVEVAWNICVAESWEKVNMREVAKKARVSNTAFYRHLKNKNDLKAELMWKGFKILNEGMKNINNNFSSYGAHYIRFGLKYPHIYDLMFGNIDFDISLYHDLEALFDEAFDGVIQGVKTFIPDASDKDVMIKAVNIWASVHGLVGILRRSDLQANKDKRLKWIKNNLEEYLKMTTFK